jgi:hypothetical protein
MFHTFTFSRKTRPPGKISRVLSESAHKTALEMLNNIKEIKALFNRVIKSSGSFVKSQWQFVDDKLRQKHPHWKWYIPFDRACRALSNGIISSCSTPTVIELIASEVTLPFSVCYQSFHTFPTRFLQNLVTSRATTFANVQVADVLPERDANVGTSHSTPVTVFSAK